LNVHGPNARRNQEIAWTIRQGATLLGLIPQFPIDLHFWGIGATIEFGGEQLSRAATIGSDIFDLLASIETQDAARAAKTASYERRADDWLLEGNLPARELTHIGRQLIAARISEQAAHRHYLTGRT